MAGVLSHLRRQTIADHIEVVIPTPDPGAFAATADQEETLAAIRIVAIDSLIPLGAARAEGVHRALGEFVFLGETHSFAADELWAEKLLERHQEGWSVVVPGFANANPGSLLSWAGFLGQYGTWMAENQAGELGYWPLNNASCRRAALLDEGIDLAHGLSYGDQLLLALEERGHQVYLEPSARLKHLNVATTRSYFDERWVGGVLVARHRSRDWPIAKRLLYTLASPLIGLILFSRVAGAARRTARRLGLPIAVLPTMLAGSMVQGLGELAGYSRIIDDEPAELRMTDYEIHKARHLGQSSP